MYSDPTGHAEVRYSYHIYLSQLGSANNYVPGYYPTPSISAISEPIVQEKETKTKSSNPITKSVESFKEIGTSFSEGAIYRHEHAYESPYNFINYLTLGTTGGIWEGLQERGKKQLDSPYDFVNHMTWGAPDTIKGAFAPKEPYSAEHWLNSIGFTSMVFGGAKFKAGSNGTGISSNSSGFGANVKVETKTISLVRINPNGTASLININAPAISISIAQPFSSNGSLAGSILFASAINGGPGSEGGEKRCNC